MERQVRKKYICLLLRRSIQALIGLSFIVYGIWIAKHGWLRIEQRLSLQLVDPLTMKTEVVGIQPVTTGFIVLYLYFAVFHLAIIEWSQPNQIIVFLRRVKKHLTTLLSLYVLGGIVIASVDGSWNRLIDRWFIFGVIWLITKRLVFLQDRQFIQAVFPWTYFHLSHTEETYFDEWQLPVSWKKYFRLVYGEQNVSIREILNPRGVFERERANRSYEVCYHIRYSPFFLRVRQSEEQILPKQLKSVKQGVKA